MSDPRRDAQLGRTKPGFSHYGQSRLPSCRWTVLVERMPLVVAMQPTLMLVNRTDRDATTAG